MYEMIHEAGWGIWPVLILGSAFFFLAVYHALSPRKETLALLKGVGIALIIAGCLGAVTGVQHSAAYIGEVKESERWIFLLGLRESLHNVVVAFVIACAATLIATVGSFRLARRESRMAPSLARSSR